MCYLIPKCMSYQAQFARCFFMYANQQHYISQNQNSLQYTIYSTIIYVLQLRLLLSLSLSLPLPLFLPPTHSLTLSSSVLNPNQCANVPNFIFKCSQWNSGSFLKYSIRETSLQAQTTCQPGFDSQPQINNCPKLVCLGSPERLLRYRKGAAGKPHTVIQKKKDQNEKKKEESQDIITRILHPKHLCMYTVLLYRKHVLRRL